MKLEHESHAGHQNYCLKIVMIEGLQAIFILESIVLVQTVYNALC